jgi:hypothetical protein
MRAMGGGNGTWISTPLQSRSYAVKVEKLSGLAKAGSEGVNHGIATCVSWLVVVLQPDEMGRDGVVTLLTVSVAYRFDSSALELLIPSMNQVLWQGLAVALALMFFL